MELEGFAPPRPFPGARHRTPLHMKAKGTKETYTLADLRDWEEATSDVNPPIRLGVIGDPVAHSLSPQMQNAALRHVNIEMQYARFHIRPGELREALQLAREWQFLGLNLTNPHKIAAVGLMDSVDELTKKIGAVNTVRSPAAHSKDSIPTGKDSDAQFVIILPSTCAICGCSFWVPAAQRAPSRFTARRKDASGW